MKIEITVDGKLLTLSLNSNKPLSLILMENLSNHSINSRCDGNQCGGCIVLIDEKAVPSCIVPAFEIKDKKITTFDGYSKTRDCKDIERAYSNLGVKPCETCYNSKTLLIESILRRYSGKDDKIDRDDVLQDYNSIRCRCIDAKDFIAIVEEALLIRRRHNVRRA